MDKFDREDAADPAPSDVNEDARERSIDDDVTADVVPGADSGVRSEPPIIHNLPDGGLTDAGPPSNDENHPDQPEDDPLLPGVILRDRFEIVELVHSGGMGRVYKALDNRRHRSASDQIHVAIKMMRNTLNPGFDGRLALEREAARTQQLSHPNIVNIYDFDQHDDQFFIVMEWLDGESLNAVLRRTTGRPIETGFAWRIVEGVASALQYAHEHDVVHADINPSNIFITDSREIKLLDFGVARHASQPEDEDAADIVWATHSYASPEVLAGSPPSAEDDIYSLGCVAYRALTGRHPFGGESSTVAKKEQLALKHIPDLANPYWQVLKQSLSFDKSARPASASAFFVDPASADKADEPDPAPRRLKVHWLPAALAALVALMVGTWWITRDNAGDELPAVTDLPVAEQTAVVEAEPEPSEVELLLADANRAMEDSRFVEPEEDNARMIYRDALALDPTNSIALAGLREISNVYAQRVELALQAADPEGAVSALNIAGETDPGNPALSIARELLLAQANGALVNAQLAAAEGNVDLAGELLSQAEKYDLLDPAAIGEVRARIAESARESAFLDAVATADASITAGNLLAPAPDNAHEQLLELQRVYGAEPRVVASSERLVERLLNRAAFSTATEQFPVAADLLDAAAVFGVLEPDIEAARTWLQQAMELSAATERAAAASNDQAPAEDGIAESLPVDGDPGAGAAAAEANILDLAPADTDMADTETTDAAQTRAQQPVQFSELDIVNFVAPRFPPRASEAGISGMVDLNFDVNPDGSTGNVEIVREEPQDTFVPSAINAVRQWRFAERDDVVRARVRLRFDPQAAQ